MQVREREIERERERERERQRQRDRGKEREYFHFRERENEKRKRERTNKQTIIHIKLYMFFKVSLDEVSYVYNLNFPKNHIIYQLSKTKVYKITFMLICLRTCTLAPC